MSWICFRNAVLNPLYVGKATYSNKEKFGILEDNLKPPLPSSSESRSSPILAIEVAPKKNDIVQKGGGVSEKNQILNVWIRMTF